VKSTSRVSRLGELRRPLDIFCGHFGNFVVIWYILSPPLWYTVPIKIWQPWLVHVYKNKLAYLVAASEATRHFWPTICIVIVCIWENKCFQKCKKKIGRHLSVLHRKSFCQLGRVSEAFSAEINNEWKMPRQWKQDLTFDIFVTIIYPNRTERNKSFFSTYICNYIQYEATGWNYRMELQNVTECHNSM
jgi:hypothetical protein